MGIAALAYFNVSVVTVRPHTALEFVAIAMAPPVDVPVRIETPPPPALVKPPEPPPEPKIEAPPPVVVKTPEPEVPPPPAPKPVAKKPDVTVGAFDKTQQAVAPPPPRQVASTVFDTVQAVAPSLSLKVSPTGAFDKSNAAPRPGSDVAKGTVTSTGFDQHAAVVQTAARGVAATAFDTTHAAAAAQPPKPQVVQQSGFAPATPPPVAQPVAKPIGPTTPVEILFKPVPEYAEEARAQHIEGEITLEVDFLSTGAVRVVRVVKGLGHGLDEKAIDAAAHIRFKPALDQGQPIDSRADVRILFRLT